MYPLYTYPSSSRRSLPCPHSYTGMKGQNVTPGSTTSDHREALVCRVETRGAPTEDFSDQLPSSHSAPTPHLVSTPSPERHLLTPRARSSSPLISVIPRGPPTTRPHPYPFYLQNPCKRTTTIRSIDILVVKLLPRSFHVILKNFSNVYLHPEVSFP